MKRLIAMAATLAALSTACADGGAQPLGPAPSTEPATSPTALPTGELETPSPTPQTMTYELWFNYGGYLSVTRRTGP
ncbi:MAG: hypothetical protein M3138_04675, partial [Actinomycetota bacterium]|nr:hypothetical protein [Actinomycetota bacterium]